MTLSLLSCDPMRCLIEFQLVPIAAKAQTSPRQAHGLKSGALIPLLQISHQSGIETYRMGHPLHPAKTPLRSITARTDRESPAQCFLLLEERQSKPP